MKDKLRILILEDSAADAELATDELEEAGISFVSEVVDRRDGFIKALDDFLPDIILSDYSLPSFDGLSALEIAKVKSPDTPFIFVSGAMGEETAIELLQKGATDYVLKNRLSRLGPAVSRALHEAEVRRERRHAEEELREASFYARSLIEASIDPLITIDASGKIADVNRATESITGFSREQLIGSSFADYFTEPEKAQKAYEEVFSKGFVRDYPLEMWHVSGRTTPVHYNASLVRNEAGDVKCVFAAARDITERVKAEKRILANNELLRQLTWELVMAEERERRNIAVDLHDNIGQTLAITKMKLEFLLEQSAPCGLVAPLAEIRDMIEQSIRQARSLMKDISPSVLYELGFAEAVEWLAEQISSQHGLRVVVEKDPGIRLIDREVQILLFRAVRELLLNVVKHAGAKQASVLLQKAGANVVITVRDDGVGFDVSGIDRTSKKSGGFGLLSIRERISYIGGRFEIETRKGEGACFRLTAPRRSRKKTLRRVV
ncbi:MAG: Sensor histidine kinase ComP [Syntrophaceae bacterium PtaU1.Bin231]|nr:MAG: Sensor histidine kinase ComP [Syntrophaceae bacterium PtaU1.Bin231]